MSRVNLPNLRPITVDGAIDEYLHRVARTRPWTKASDEGLLNAWSDWLFARFGADVPLCPASHVHALGFARDRGLADDECQALEELVDRMWNLSRQEG